MNAALALVFAVVSQVSPQTPPSIELPVPLARVLIDYETAWSNKDAAALSNLFAEDGFVLPNGSAPVKGREAIKEFYKSSGGPLSLRAYAYATEGSVGYILGGFTTKKGDPDAGKFTLTLRKVGDKWMIVSDMDNPNRRPQRPPQVLREPTP